MSASSPKREFASGARALAPVLLGGIPFAFVCGVEAIRTGLTIPQSLGMNVVIFAGASQLVTTQLIAEQANAFVIVLTAAAINLRFIMYSASVSPFLRRLPWYRRIPYAYMLSDQAFAVSVYPLEEEPENSHRHWFLLGAAMTLYGGWQVGAWLGTFVGGSVPAHWQVDFVVPLSFLAIVVPAIASRPMVIAAVVGGASSLLFRGLPPGTGIVLGGMCGIFAALLAEGDPSE